jgi:hypothetical protein
VNLNLNDDERRAVAEYIDDSVDPLRSIVARWKVALTREGRVPYGYE